MKVNPLLVAEIGSIKFTVYKGVHLCIATLSTVNHFIKADFNGSWYENAKL